MEKIGKWPEHPNEFEQRLDRNGDMQGWRDPIIEVGDTMEWSLLWYRAFGMEPSPGDIAAMASLIIGRKKTLHDEREAALQARVREMDERDNDS